MQTIVEIAVEEFNEGTETWHRVKALPAGDGIFTIAAENDFDPEFDDWEFVPGDTVRCIPYSFKLDGDTDKTFNMAVERLSKPVKWVKNSAVMKERRFEIQQPLHSDCILRIFEHDALVKEMSFKRDADFSPVRTALMFTFYELHEPGVDWKRVE